MALFALVQRPGSACIFDGNWHRSLCSNGRVFFTYAYGLEGTSPHPATRGQAKYGEIK